MIVKPAMLMAMAVGIYFALTASTDPFERLPLFWRTGFHIAMLCLCYLFLLAGAHFFRKDT